jgi:hypothetical protein
VLPWQLAQFIVDFPWFVGPSIHVLNECGPAWLCFVRSAAVAR